MKLENKISHQLESPSALGFVTMFSPDRPLHGTNVTASRKPACFKNVLNLLTISLKRSFDQSTVSNLLTTTANCETPIENKNDINASELQSRFIEKLIALPSDLSNKACSLVWPPLSKPVSNSPLVASTTSSATSA